MNKKGKLIRYFLKDGEFNGIKTLEIANKTILCTIIPRASITMYLKYVKEENINNAGVYILTDTPYNFGNRREIYIGEGDPVEERLKSHYQEKQFWDECIVFTSKDSYITKTQVQYLESKLIKKGKEYNQVYINQNNSKEPNISDVEKSEIEEFLDDLLLILESLQYNMFLKIEKYLDYNNENEIIYEFKRKYASSKMKVINNKYVILKNSIIIKDIESIKSTRQSTLEIREKYIKKGILKELGEGYILTDDIGEFTSPSGAAIFVAGGSLNGAKEWKYNGKTLGEIEKDFIND